MTACAATSSESGVEPVRRNGNANASHVAGDPGAAGATPPGAGRAGGDGTGKSIISRRAIPASSWLTSSSVSRHARHRVHGLVEPADQLQGRFVFDLLCQYFGLIVCNGWRRSWLAAARKRDLPRLACSVSRLAASNASVACLRSVMSSIANRIFRPPNASSRISRAFSSRSCRPSSGSSIFDIANSSTDRSKSCLADNNNRILAAMIASGSRKRVKRPRRCSLRKDKLPSRRFQTPYYRPINRRENRARRGSHRRCRSVLRSKHRSPRVADGARNPAIKICAHPRLGKIRHDCFPGRQDLWGCRRQDRAHSPVTLTALRPLGRGLRLASSSVKENRHAGAGESSVAADGSTLRRGGCCSLDVKNVKRIGEFRDRRDQLST
jgi:hypothetical protein